MVANKDIKKGELFSEDSLVAKRTGGVGISPIDYKSIIGVKSHKSYKKNEVISLA
jgi:sialic acid synthase SpsE